MPRNWNEFWQADYGFPLDPPICTYPEMHTSAQHIFGYLLAISYIAQLGVQSQPELQDIFANSQGHSANIVRTLTAHGVNRQFLEHYGLLFPRDFGPPGPPSRGHLNLDGTLDPSQALQMGARAGVIRDGGYGGRGMPPADDYGYGGHGHSSMMAPSSHRHGAGHSAHIGHGSGESRSHQPDRRHGGGQRHRGGRRDDDYDISPPRPRRYGGRRPPPQESDNDESDEDDDYESSPPPPRRSGGRRPPQESESDESDEDGDTDESDVPPRRSGRRHRNIEEDERSDLSLPSRDFFDGGGRESGIPALPRHSGRGGGTGGHHGGRSDNVERRTRVPTTAQRNIHATSGGLRVEDVEGKF